MGSCILTDLTMLPCFSFLAKKKSLVAKYYQLKICLDTERCKNVKTYNEIKTEMIQLHLFKKFMGVSIIVSMLILFLDVKSYTHTHARTPMHKCS